MEVVCCYSWPLAFCKTFAARSAKALTHTSVSPLKPRSSQKLTQSAPFILCSGSIKSCRVWRSISRLASSTALAIRKQFAVFAIFPRALLPDLRGGNAPGLHVVLLARTERFAYFIHDRYFLSGS